MRLCKACGTENTRQFCRKCAADRYARERHVFAPKSIFDRPLNIS